MELGPHPPDRLSCPDDGPTSARPVLLIPTQELALARVTERGRRTSAGHQPSSHEPGGGRLSPSTASLSWISSWPTSTTRSFAPTRSAWTPPVAQSPPCRSELRRCTLRCSSRPKPWPSCQAGDSAMPSSSLRGHREEWDGQSPRRPARAGRPVNRVQVEPDNRRLRASRHVARDGRRHRPLAQPAAWG